ncbi:MAG: GIY-YIG nuclease family protein, partial [Arenicellales bacterium]
VSTEVVWIATALSGLAMTVVMGRAVRGLPRHCEEPEATRQSSFLATGGSAILHLLAKTGTVSRNNKEHPSMGIPCVYILANKRNGTLYTGVTSDLVKRVWEHKSDIVDGFSCRYGVHRLVWYEVHGTMVSAIEREKQIKAGSRKRKLKLIENMNPRWRDLYSDIL